MKRFEFSCAGGQLLREAVTGDFFCEQMDAFGEHEQSLCQDTFTTEMKFLTLLNLLCGIHV